MELQITDYLRIIADLCLTMESVKKNIDTLEKIISKVKLNLKMHEDYDFAVVFLSVLFCYYQLNEKVVIEKFSAKNWLFIYPETQEDLTFLYANKYVNIGAHEDVIEWIMILNKLYFEIWNNMTDQNRDLFLLVAGKQLNGSQLRNFKSQLFNEGLDICELFRTAVVCRQISAAKAIIDFGYEMNKQPEDMGYELFICSQYNSKFCIDFYLEQGLIITDELIKIITNYAEENSDDFVVEKTYQLIEELKQRI